MKLILTEDEVKRLVKSIINEMGPRDWRLVAIMKMWDDAQSIEERRHISNIVTNKENSDREKVLNYLHDFDHSEMSEVADRLGLYND